MRAPSRRRVRQRIAAGWHPARAAAEPVAVQLQGDGCPGTGPRVGGCGGVVTRGRFCEACAEWLLGPARAVAA